MFVSRVAVSCRFSIQRESCATVEKAMSSSFVGREAASVLLKNRSCRTTDLAPGIIGFHLVAGASPSSSASFFGPVRRSYTAASVFLQLEAASARSASVMGNCTSFSPSANVVVETSGPNAGPAPNAGGAPGGKFEGFCARSREAAAALSSPREVTVKNSLRDLDIVFLGPFSDQNNNAKFAWCGDSSLERRAYPGI